MEKTLASYPELSMVTESFSALKLHLHGYALILQRLMKRVLNLHTTCLLCHPLKSFDSNVSSSSFCPLIFLTIHNDTALAPKRLWWRHSPLKNEVKMEDDHMGSVGKVVADDEDPIPEWSSIWMILM